MKQPKASNPPRRSTWRISPFPSPQFLPSILLAVIVLTIFGCEDSQEMPLRSHSSDGRSVCLLSDTNFDREVINNTQPVLVDFWASWCRPCLKMKPAIQELGEEFASQAKVGELDAEANAFTAEKYAVENLPTILIFHNGVIVRRLEGLQTKEELTRVLENVILSSQ